MDAQTCILTRRSVRQFTDQPVPHDLLEKVVSLAAYAPQLEEHSDQPLSGHRGPRGAGDHRFGVLPGRGQ